MITDERLERALKYLATTDESCAEKKADVERYEYLCKLARKKEFLVAVGTVAQREAEAEVSASVQRAEEEKCRRIVAYEAEAAKRKTEALIVDVYRTIAANRRAGGI